MHRILIIEDEPDLRKGLEVNLSREGFKVFQANNGETGISLAIKHNPDLILLDVMMPGMNGIDVCREIRRKGLETPIIMLTARSDEIDRVVGLEVGADDYVTKPFSVRELVARIRARLRRVVKADEDGLLRYAFGNVELDFEKLQARRAGEPIDLTPREFDILRLLIQCRGEVVTRDRLLDEVWGFESFPTTRTVDNFIMKLRKKLEDNPTDPKHILSIYGEGYKFVD
ncbi:MAG: response regulator transcription factor [Acidobacteriota bacterium]